MTGTTPKKGADAGVPCVRVLEFGHSLMAVDWSPNGTQLAVGDSVDAVEVLTTDGQRLWRHAEHQGYLYDVRWSPDGRQLASASRGGQVIVWNAATGVARFTGSTRPNNGTSVDWSPDGQRVACGADAIFFFDANSGEKLDERSSSDREARSVAWSPDGSYLAVGHFGGEIRLTDGRSPQEIAPLIGHEKRVRWLAWAPDGHCLASASWDGTLRIWNVSQRQPAHVLDDHANRVESVSWSPKGNLLASGSGDKTVRLWDPQTGQQLVRLDEHQSSVVCVAFSPDGTRLASASNDKTVRIWDVSALLPANSVAVENPTLDAYAARQAATVGRRAVLRAEAPLWVPEIREWKGEGRDANSVVLSADGRSAVAGFNEGSVRRLDLSAGSEIWRKDKAHQEATWDIALSRSEDLVASSSHDQTVGIWECGTGRLVTRIADHSQAVWKSAFSPRDNLLASTSANHAIKVYSPKTGEMLSTLSGHRSVVNAIDWHPDGSLLASGSDDDTVRVWDVHKKTEIQQHAIHTRLVRSVSWSPDGERLASASEDQTVVIWSLRRQQEVARLNGHKSGVICSIWSPDGRFVASGGYDSTIRLWDPTTGQEIHRFEFEETYAWRLSWAASGAFLAASLQGDTVRIFDTRDFLQGRPQPAVPGPEPTPLAPQLKPLPGVFAHLLRLGLVAPLSHLHSLLGLLAGTPHDEPLAPLQAHPAIRQLAALRWPRAARTGLLALLLRHLPRDERFAPPAGATAATLRDALEDALRGEPIEPRAPVLPVAALLQAADALDERLFTLLQLLGPDSVAADPGLPLRLLPQVPSLPALTAPKRRLLGLRLDLDAGSPAHGHGPGAERTGLDLRGDFRALLPSQLALPENLLRARYLRGDLLYRTRGGQEPPKLRPTVILLDVSPPTFGPVEATTRLAAHAVAASLIEARLPVVLVTAGGSTKVIVLERPSDLVDIWTSRSLEPANETQALRLARAMRETLIDGDLSPVILLLSHTFFAADADPLELPALRGLFVEFPNASARPSLAEACERWLSVATGQIEGLGERVGGLVG